MDRCVAYGASLSKNLFQLEESGAKYREQRKKEGESEETVRVREEVFFLFCPYTDTLFFSAHFFLARLLYLKAGTGHPLAGA